jgi:cell division topological specificity factor
MKIKPMIFDQLENLFPWKSIPKSAEEAKRRLKVVIAHDRAGLSPEILESMRQDILEVVSRYVDIDSEEMEFVLESDQRITALIANLPIRRLSNKTSIPPQSD